MKKICVFCGSSSGGKPIYLETAKKLGKELSEQGFELIYGGARIGLMGAIADEVLRYGGKVIGVIPKDLMDREVAHLGLTKLHVVASMHDRKALMADLADGFIALPGGFGTLEEIIEVLTWAQLSIHAKPCGILNVANYYDPLFQMFDHAMEEGFMSATHHKLMIRSDSPIELLQRMADHRAPDEIELYAHFKDKI